MTDNFGDQYSQAYDSFYNDKDYYGECNQLEKFFNMYSNKQVKNILDLGCGTGGHAIELAKRGYFIDGVDKSHDMLDIAQNRIKSNDINQKITLYNDDIRKFEILKKFDVVISMFAVMSYMTTNEDLICAFKTARHHLNPGGLFIFDAWSGSAVLCEKPEQRIRDITFNKTRIIRIAKPGLDILHNTVNVQYKLLEINNNTIVNEVDENHIMRYFFPMEIQYYLHNSGFYLELVAPFLHPSNCLSEKDWELVICAKAIE
jgi:predicted TPR repeat methyltransferase